MIPSRDMANSVKSILFNDAHGSLGPLNDLRPAHAVRTGALTTAERLTAAFDLDPIGIVVPNEMVELAKDQTALPVNEPPEESDDEILMINGRCALPIEAIEKLELGEVAIEKETSDMIAMRLTARDVRSLLSGGNPEMRTVEVEDHVLLRRPWDWRAFRDRCLEFDLNHVMRTMLKVDQSPAGVAVLGQMGVAIHPEAEISPGVVLDATRGAIVIEENVTIRPGAVVVGPVYIGPGTMVLEQALIKGATAIGPVCKVAGEIGGTIFQGYANKAHAGHLGDSWVGEWVNLGADTTNSNLLNTYEEVVCRATSTSKREKTGHQFLGATLGDHTKTAIGTRIMTGAIAGTGVMYAATGAMTGTLDPFAWVTDSGTKSYRLGKFVEIAMSVMERRGVIQSQAYARRLTVLHERATGESSGMNWPGKPVTAPDS